MKQLFAIAKYLVIVGLLVTVGALIMSKNRELTKILVVHSYNTDMSWVNEVDSGIARALETNKQGINLRTHYMNLRNHPDCNFYKNAASDVRFTIDDWQPSAIILVYDLAQALVGFNHLSLQADADRNAIAEELTSWLARDRCERPDSSFFGLDNPATAPLPEIVFAGVNGGVERYGYHLALNVSGIFERKNYRALVQTLDALSQAYTGDVGGVTMINDASPTGVTENTNFALQDWAPFAADLPTNARNLDEWQRAVEEANARDLMILIANYENVVDATGRLVSPEALISWTEREAKLPVLGANTRFVADGGMMTVAIAGSEQGSVALGLAQAALGGAAERPQVDAKQFVIGMNQSLVRKRDLELPAIYEAFSREIGTFVGALEQLYVVQSGDL